MPSNTEALDITPLVQNFSPKATTITIIARLQFPMPPHVGLDILNSPAPPAAY